MGVGVPEMRDAPAALSRGLKNDGTVPGGIYHYGFFCLRISDEIGIRYGRAKCEGNNLKHSSPFAGKINNSPQSKQRSTQLSVDTRPLGQAQRADQPVAA